MKPFFISRRRVYVRVWGAPDIYRPFVPFDIVTFVPGYRFAVAWRMRRVRRDVADACAAAGIPFAVDPETGIPWIEIGP